jgi:hypothetical protein
MLLLILKCLLITHLTAVHPFYVSVTEMEFRSGTNEAGVSTKFFTEDFEEMLKKVSGKKIDLRNGDTAVNKRVIASYLQDHLAVAVNKSKLAITFLGYENDKEATWCYYSLNGAKNVSAIDITCDFLYGLKDEQTNIFHVLVDGKRKSHVLDNPDKEIHFTF